MQGVPLPLHIIFALITLVAAWLFYGAANKSRFVLVLTISWLLLQAIISLTGFYTNTVAIPPRFSLLIGPPLLLIIALFATRKGRQFLDSLHSGTLTLIHTLRIPVELTLFALYLQGMVPQLMTFEGRNYDILSGLTAPIIWWAAHKLKALPSWALVTWNILCLGLLFNIVTIAILSAPFPFQALAFDQPNIGVLYFPFTWLPGFIVPLVLLSHLTAIRACLVRRHTGAVAMSPAIKTVERVG
jgi:hypothetical protein